MECRPRSKEAFRVDTTVLRVLAIVLIANSHLEDFYPFRQLAADGLLGNSLFFMLSGLGIALSARTGTERFVDWYRRRLFRIYPALWLTMLAGPVLLQGAWRRWTLVDFLSAFIWPTHYAFLMLIVLFYPAFYLLRALKSARVEWSVIVALSAAYIGVAVVRYDLHVLSWIYYFQMMLVGGLLAGQVTAMASHSRRHLAVLIVAMVIYVGVKLAMTTGRIPTHIGVLHLLTYPIVISLLGLCTSALVQRLTRLPRLGRVLAFVAGLTLEIYLVHDFVYKDRRVSGLSLPVNLAAFWALTLLLAWAVSAASTRGRQIVVQVLWGRDTAVRWSRDGTRLARGR
jgi:peptidoglycan/LPS O-acetylase OafA/YrhL